MAKFTATVPLKIRLPGGFEIDGAVGATHRIPDSLYDEFVRDQVPLIPGGVTWVSQDETSAIVGFDPSTKYDKTGGTISGAVTITGAATISGAATIAGALTASSTVVAPKIAGVVYADRYSSIQAAINDAPATNATVFIPAGSYSLSAALTTKPGLTLRGEGRATKITQTADAPIVTVASTDAGVTIRDMWIVGTANTAHTNNRGVLVNGADRTRLADLFVDSCDKGIFINVATRLSITGCYVSADRSTLGAIDCVSVTTGNVSGCIIDGPATHGLDIRETCIGVVASGNEVLSAANTAYVISASCQDCTLIGNVARSPLYGVIVENLSSNALVAGNIISGATSQGILLSNGTGEATKISVTGNMVTGAVGTGIFVNGCSKANITGNEIIACGLDGIKVSGAQAVGTVIAGNTIHGSTSSTGRAIYVTASAAYCSITGNNLRDNAGVGINVDADHCSVIGNSVVDSDSTNVLATGGIVASGNADYSTITGNISAASAGTTKQDYGIIVQAGASSVVVADNVVYQNQTAALSNAGTGTLLSNNIGYVSRSAGVASVANAGTITHGLATTPTKYGTTGTVAKHTAVVTAVSTTTLTIGLHDDTGAAVTVAENVAWWAEL